MTPGIAILIFGFVFFASVFGGSSDKKLEMLEQMAKITSGFIASVFTLSGILMIITLPIWLCAALIMGLVRQVYKTFVKKTT